MSSNKHTEGITSLLDTDLYKLTMQCAVLKHFPNVKVSYKFTNRTPQMQLTQEAFDWLHKQIQRLGDIQVTEDEIRWLRTTCPYFSTTYLEYLRNLRLRPNEQVDLRFERRQDSSSGALSLEIHGLWDETILYEIPLLALISEAYFKFVDKDWNHDCQVELAKRKGLQLLEAGCVFSEFGSRRRRDGQTHESVMKGLTQAAQEAASQGFPGKLSGTSNVHLAMQFNVTPVGTVAHEWFMGIAALNNDYSHANEAALRAWIDTYGQGVLGIALTDTFGTPAFLKAFARPLPEKLLSSDHMDATYAQVFTGVRQDSGDPLEFVKLMQTFYREQGIHEAKTIVFSDSLDVEKCIKYKKATEDAGLTASFGVGTHFTNDYKHLSKDEKSVPLNIVIKLSEANGLAAVKLSDNQGKNMGPEELVAKIKNELGYTEKKWSEGDEAHRWDGKA
ncbi:hypothetical protein AMS68_003098 [Peltaster fructicola]|uniref:Nicotinate phosphoribosyltransferase n=1 Tax=Peltaster fructicola TaxID=286661 RepID=A0A6H0XSE8_9PEZI|nr:hypothetical protein AMS68_003098 [Peltaster fructicola]